MMHIGPRGLAVPPWMVIEHMVDCCTGVEVKMSKYDQYFGYQIAENFLEMMM